MLLLLLLLVLDTFICRTIPASHCGSSIKVAQQLRGGMQGSPVPREILLAVCKDCRCSSVCVDSAFKADCGLQEDGVQGLVSHRGRPTESIS